MAGIYLDLQKAFDTVDHNILLTKLNHYGIKGHSLSWFQNYLFNRKQYTEYNKTKSSIKNISTGVPQGSVLGPLLFLLYINDISNCTQTDCTPRLFADDTNLFINSDSFTHLKQLMTSTLKDIHNWLIANKLTLNSDKTCYTIFSHNNLNTPKCLNSLTFNNITIKRVKSTRYLGVILDENLNWNDHIDTLTSSLIKLCNSFKIIKHQVPDKNKINLFYAYIYSKINYGIEVYGAASKSQINKIQRLQNKAIKILFNVDYFTPTIDLHKRFEIPLVTDIYKISLLKVAHKHQNNQLPAVFDNFLIKNNQIHTYNTRQISNLHISCTLKHSKLKNNISHHISHLWNDIPNNIKNIKNNNKFGKNLKKYFIKQY